MELRGIFPLGMHKKSNVMIYLQTESFTIFPPVNGFDAAISICSFHAQPLSKPYDLVFNDHISIDKCNERKRDEPNP